MGVRIWSSALAFFTPLLVGGCGAGSTDPLWDQLREDMAEIEQRSAKRAMEAFISEWDYLGAKTNATCMVLEHVPMGGYANVQIIPGGGPVAAASRGERDYRATEEWRLYCARPVNDASGTPVRYSRGTDR